MGLPLRVLMAVCAAGASNTRTKMPSTTGSVRDVVVAGTVRHKTNNARNRL